MINIFCRHVSIITSPLCKVLTIRKYKVVKLCMQTIRRDNLLCNVTGSVVFVDFCPWAKPLIKCVVRQTRGSQDPHHGYLIKFACVCVCFFLHHKSKFDQSFRSCTNSKVENDTEMVVNCLTFQGVHMIGNIHTGVEFPLKSFRRRPPVCGVNSHEVNTSFIW